MFLEDLIDVDAPNNFKTRRNFPLTPVKILKRSASVAQLKFREKHTRPFKRQALEMATSSEEDEQSSDSLDTLFGILGLNDDSQDESGEGAAPALEEPRCDLSLSDAIIDCPYTVPNFKGLSLTGFFNECSFNSYLTMLPSYTTNDNSLFNCEAMEYFEKQLMVKQLMSVFDVSEIKTLFLVCERACPFIFHKAIERTLLLDSDWINPILSVMFQLCVVSDILGKTVLMLVESRAVQVDLKVLKKACVLFNFQFPPETFVAWIRDGVNNTTLSFMIAYCTIDESVLKAALTGMRSSMLVSLLAQKLPTIPRLLVLLALAREYPEGIVNQLMGRCSCPQSIQAAMKDPALFESIWTQSQMD